MDKQKIGIKLEKLRKERGETMGEVAEAVGTTYAAISMYESGKRIPRDHIKENISRHFGVPVEEIFFAE